jgi:putative addiction module CopG family antidote
MVELQVSLPESLSEYAAAQVSSGRFSSVDDYLEALVRADAQAQRAAAQLRENPQVAALLAEGLNCDSGRRWSPAVLDELKHQVARGAQGSRS